MARILFILLCAWSYALANADNPNKAFSAEVDWNTPYKCFSDLGKHNNTTKELISSAKIESTCFPSTSTVNGCQMQWKWSIDYKDSSVTEVDPNCHYNCRQGLTYGIHGRYKTLYGAINTYRYCVKKDDWTKIARCVNKDSGTEADASNCDNNVSGHYWKPKCESNDTVEVCENKMKAYTEWTMCSKTSEVNNISEAGANSIWCYPYKRCYLEKNCASHNNILKSDYPSGGNQNKTDPDKPGIIDMGGIIVQDMQDSTSRLESFIHTKIAGGTYNFKVFVLNNQDAEFSGNAKVQCMIKGDYSNGTHQATKQGSYFTFSSDAIAYSGDYNIECIASTDTSTITTHDVPFYATPEHYQFSKLEATRSTKGDKVDLLNGKSQKLKYREESKLTFDDTNWTNKPIAITNGEIKVIADSIIALNAKGAQDIGVNGTMSVLSATPTMKSIKSDSSILPTNFPANTINATSCPPSSDGKSLSILMANDQTFNKGAISQNALFLTFGNSDAQIGTMQLVLQDKTILEKINNEKARGACVDTDGAWNVCPYPAKLDLTFNYQIVPADFKIELLDEKGKEVVRVLYFGQGSTPAVEAKNKLRITALKRAASVDGTNDEVAEAFSAGCAAQDMLIEPLASSSNGQYHITIINDDGTAISAIPRGDFKNGKAEVDKIIKVNKTKDIDFTPAMDSEPVKVEPGDMQGTMEFHGYPSSTTSYPSYTPKVNANTKSIILRARINAIDTDNQNGSGISKGANAMQVFYEFQCKYCNLKDVREYAGNATLGNKRSVTQQGWFVDTGFGSNSKAKLESKMIFSESGQPSVDSVTSNVNQGVQEVRFNDNAKVGTHKINILHGNYCGKASSNPTPCTTNTASDKAAMPNFLLHNVYWQDGIKWHTSAFVHIYGDSAKNDRSYGLDVDGARTTRGNSRTGGF